MILLLRVVMIGGLQETSLKARASVKSEHPHYVAWRGMIIVQKRTYIRGDQGEEGGWIRTRRRIVHIQAFQGIRRARDTVERGRHHLPRVIEKNILLGMMTNVGGD